MKYKCWYHIGDKVLWCLIDSIAWAKEGFWIDIQGNFTNSLSAHRWIPPAAIMCVDHFEEVEKH